MSKINKSYEIKADNAVNILSTEVKLKCLESLGKNIMSESSFAAISQPLFFVFGGITLAKMLIDSKSYKKQHMDNKEGNGKKPTRYQKH